MEVNMIVDLRTYTLKTGTVPKFLELFENIGLPIQKRILGNFIAMFRQEFGNPNQVIHLWGFENLTERERRRAECAADLDFQAYVKNAREYIASGNFYWNSGMFIWQASTILKLFQTHLPNHYKLLEELKSIPANSENLKSTFNLFDSISIDYGILEKASDQTVVIQSNFSWSDIGSWSALDDFLEKDDQNNASNTKTIALNSQNNIIHTQNKPVALIDIKDTILLFFIS